MNIYQSEKEFLCAEVNGKNIHSKYNPVREAERFIKASIKSVPSMIVLLGAGLGYVQEQAVTLFPGIPVISLFYDDILHKNCFYKNKNITSWFPSSQSSIHSFISSNILEQALSNIAIIEWNPSALIYKELSGEVNKCLKALIQQLNGNIFTTAAFGKKWIRNMISNYISLENYCTIDSESDPIVIASSGPTLDRSIENIHKYRKKFRLWALPSSLKALKYHGITPDLLISTDPGYYGSFHLQFLDESVPVAMPLTASRGIWQKNNPAVILNQSMPFENDLFSIDKQFDLKINSNGTVSGTALEMALLKSSRIYFTGLDLCYRDIRSHIKPHSFDTLLISQTQRFNSIQSLYYHRAADSIPDIKLGIRTSRSLETYRNWFVNKCRNPSVSIKRLNSSPIKIDNMINGEFSDFHDSPDLPEQRIIRRTAENIDMRKKKIRILLEKWEKELLGKDRDELLYFIDIESYTKGLGYENAINFISSLRGVYG